MTKQHKTITALQGLEKHTATLDAQSAVALDYITFWAGKHLSVRPAPGVVIRRALQVLAQHLSDLAGHQQRAEWRGLEDAGRGKGTARSLTEARARIEAHLEAPARQPLAHWRDALHSADHREEVHRMCAQLGDWEAHGK